MRIASPDFADGQPMDIRFTQEGQDISPALHFADVPKQARSLVLIVDDPDAPDPQAPRCVWLHWLVANLPATCTGLPEAIEQMPEGAQVAVNDSGFRGYSGPKPPIGVHRYYFKLFALDCMLELGDDFTRAELERSMSGHILAQAQTMGTYILSKNRP